MKRILNAAFAGASLLALTVPTTTFAQSSSEEASSGDEIVVTTRRREESIQDVPAVVNAVTAEAIEKLNLRKFEDIQAVVPGLSLTANANGIGAVSTVRGTDFNVNVSGNNGTIEFYMNDAPLSSNVLFQSMFDIGQIEVLRGPQGTLRGRASPSGAINVTMRKPDLSEIGGNVSFTVTDSHGINGTGAVSLPIIKDKLAVRLAGVLSNDHGNEVKSTVGINALKNETQGFRASVQADPFDGIFVVDFMMQDLIRRSFQYDQVQSFSEVVSGGAASPLFISAKDRLAVDNVGRSNRQHFRVYNWQAKLNLAGQSLTYVGLKLRQHLKSIDPGDDAGIFASDTAAGNLFATDTDTQSKSTSHEIRLQNEARIGGIFDYVVGYLDYDAPAVTNLKNPTGIGVVSPRAILANVALTPIQRPGHSHEKSIFGNLTAHIGEKIELSGGVRRIRYKSDSGLLVNGAPVAAFTRKTDEGKTIYSAAARYKITDDVMVYGNMGTSWRPSAVAVTTSLPAPTAQQAAFLAVDSETSKSFELGLKSEFWDKKATFNLAVYRQKYTNYPYRAPGIGVYAVSAANNTVQAVNFVSGVPVLVKGVEAELSLRPAEGFSIGGVLGYSKGNIVNGTIPCTDLNGDGVPDVVSAPPSLAALQAATGAAGIDSCSTNIRSNNSSRWSGSLQSEYATSITGNVDGYVRGLYSWKGGSQNDPVNAFDDVSSYGILNMYLGLRSANRNWEVSFFAKNLTNTFRVLQRSNGAISTALRGGIPLGPLGTSAGTSSITNYFGDLRVTEPREFGVNLRFAFGSR